jgi:hypothetical protein
MHCREPRSIAEIYKYKRTSFLFPPSWYSAHFRQIRIFDEDCCLRLANTDESQGRALPRARRDRGTRLINECQIGAINARLMRRISIRTINARFRYPQTLRLDLYGEGAPVSGRSLRTSSGSAPRRRAHLAPPAVRLRRTSRGKHLKDAQTRSTGAAVGRQRRRRRSSSVTMKSSSKAKAVRTRMPAKTVLMSKAPSAWRIR